MNKESPNVKQVLQQVKGLFTSPSTWRKGKLKDVNGRMCLLGGFGKARNLNINSDLYEGLESDPAARAFAQQIDPDLRRGVATTIYMWNDDKDRTFAEVHAKLDEVIAAQGS